jgi:hypothetical protein
LIRRLPGPDQARAAKHGGQYGRGGGITDTPVFHGRDQAGIGTTRANPSWIRPCPKASVSSANITEKMIARDSGI